MTVHRHVYFSEVLFIDFSGPLLGGYFVKQIGFKWVMRIVGIVNLLYCPFCYFLRNIPVQDESVVSIISLH